MSSQNWKTRPTPSRRKRLCPLPLKAGLWRCYCTLWFLALGLLTVTGGPGELKWSLAIPGGSAFSPPTLATNGDVLLGTGDGNLYAVTPDGNIRWSFSTPRSVLGVPLVATDGTIYFGSDKLYALNSDGIKLWEFDHFVWTDNYINYMGPPVLGPDGAIYVTRIASGDQPRLFVLEPDQTVRWILKRRFSGPVVLGEDGTIFLSEDHGYFSAVNPDGVVRWTTTVGGWALSSGTPIANGGVLVPVVGSTILEGAIQALTATGSNLWRFEGGSPAIGTPVIGPDGAAYAVFNAGRIVALETNGSVRWEYQTENLPNTYPTMHTPALAADGTLYVTSEQWLYALNASGQLLWRYDAGRSELGAPLLGPDGTIYFSANGETNVLFAVEGTGAGLAASSWPMGRRDARHSASLASSQTIPPAPTGLAARDFTDKVLLTWNSTPPATHYQVLRSTTINPADAVVITNGLSGGVSFADRSCIPGETNYYFVRAANAAGTSPAVGPVAGQRRVANVGEAVWIVPTGGAVGSAAAIGPDGTAYFGASDGKLHAVDGAGQLQWSFTFGGASSTPPAVGADGTIYFAAATTFYPHPIPNALFAVTPTGQLLWRIDVPESSVNSPAIGADGTLYFALETRLLALSPAGSNLWTFTNGRSFSRTPAIGADGTIYCGTTDGYLVAVAPNGVRLWEGSSGDGSLRTPVIGDNGVLFTSAANFHAFNPDGQKLWSYALTSGSSSGPSLLTTQGVVYAQAEKTYFRFSTNGSNVHKFILPAAQDNSQTRVVADSSETVYVSVYSGVTAKLYAMSAAGVKQWEYSILQGDFGNPTLGSNNLLLVPAADGLHALRTSAGLGTSAWPHPLHDPAHTSRATQTPPLPAAPVAEATIRTRITDVRVSWNSVLAASSYEVYRSDTTEPADAILLGAVIGQLFYDDKSAVPETDYFYWVKARNLTGSSPFSAPVAGVRRQAVPGEILYRWPLGTPINGSPAIGADGTIYATGGRKIVALNPDGTVQWEHPVSWPVLSSPALGPDGAIYVGVQATLNQTLSPSPLLALNPDGSERWRFTASNNIRGTPAVGADGNIYFTTDSISASQPGVLYALAANGNLLWSLPLSRVTDASVAIARDGTLYVFTRDGRLSAVSSTGVELWNVAAGTAPAGDTLRPSPAIGADGTIFVSGGALRAFLPDGRLRWQTTNGTFYSSPTLAPDGSVLVSSQEGWIHLVRDGTNVWRYQTSAVNRGAAAFASPNLIYAPGPAGQLLTLTLAGSNVWQAPAGSLWSSSPAIAPDGTIYVSTAEGEVVSVFGAAPLADTPWPMFQHDIRHTGRNLSPAITPSLLTQPASLTVRQGAPVNLAVDVAGYPWPAFQWFFNDSALPGATARNFTLLSVLPSDAGTYRVTATNEAGHISSSNALLTVLPCALVPAGAVAWWPGESNLLDSASVNDFGLNNQTLSSNSFLAGKSGLGFRLTNNSYLTTAYSEELDLGAGPGLTIEGWINPDSIASAQPLLEWNDGVSRIGAGLMINPAHGVGALEAWFADTNSIPARTVRVSAASAGIVSNVWQHVALTFDKATGVATIYAGGVPLTQTNLGTFRPLTGTPVYLGYRRAGSFMGNYFRGGLDEFALYDRALSAAEIQSIVTANDGGKCLPPPACTPPTFNLVAWWRGESNALDQVSGNHGMVTQTISFTNGAVGTAFQFSTGVIRVGANSNLNVGLHSGLTVEGWFKTAVPGFQPLLEWNSGTGTQGVTLATASTRALQANLVDVNGFAHVINSPQQILTNGTWQHLALTYDRASGIAALYRSGIKVAQTNLGSFVPRTDSDFFLGYRPPGAYTGSGVKYTGAMDEISLYARALSAAEIRAVMRSRGEGKCLSAPPVSRFTHVELQPNGRVRLRMVGTFPFVAHIQSSTNLLDWQSIGMPQPATGGEFEFEDDEPASLPARYYRLTLP
jgi:sugar lactone lactonase YvrE